MFDLNRLIRKNIRDLVPYSSARSEYAQGDAILMDANESPFNRPYNRYPDPLQRELRAVISAELNIDPAQLFLGNGSDEAIDLIYRAFCEPGVHHAISMDPSYGMFEVCARINDVGLAKASLTDEFQMNPGAIMKLAGEQTRLIFICSPNNPSGNCFREEDILSVIRRFPGLVIIDEAYIDFADFEGFASRINEFPNLVVLRTFSKAWALAGVRLGMAIAGKEIIGILNKIKYPYNVNLLTQEKVLKQVRLKEQKNNWVKTIRKEKLKMITRLEALDQVEHIYPSDANFLLVRFRHSEYVFNKLKNSKIVLRDRSRLHLCEGCLRITVGSRQENDSLISKLQQLWDEKSIIHRSGRDTHHRASG